MQIRPIPITDAEKGVEIIKHIFSLYAEPCALFAVYILCIWIILRIVNKEKDRKYTYIPLVIAAALGIILLVVNGTSLTAVKGMLLTGIMLYASLSDIHTREVPDYVSVQLLLLSFVNFSTDSLLSMLIGAVAVFIPQIALAVIRPKRSIGGADIKISTALAFMLGAEKGLFAIILGLTLAVGLTIIYEFIRKVKSPTNEPKNAANFCRQTRLKKIPMVPFLAVGAIISYMI